MTTEQKQAKRDIARSIKDKFDRLQPFSPESACIYRVHKGLRQFNPHAYTPVLVSIGPYHQNSKRYSAIKKYKLWYSRSLLIRDSKDLTERCVSELKQLEATARTYYAEPIGLNSDQFVELMLLDGCFVVGYICSKTTEPSKRDDPLLDVDWMDSQICHDMMLLENQLPFVVLSKLFEITNDPAEMSFLKRAIWVCVTSMLPKPRSVEKLDSRIRDVKDIKHLLHLVHIISSPSKPMSSGNNTRNSKEGRVLGRMRSVEELKEFGVRFEKVGNVDKSTDGGIDDISILDVEFSKGLMRVPSFRFEISTDTFFLNLIAYEQYSSDKNLVKNFTDFAYFMDQLINSVTDVNLLRHEGIIVNLGDEKEVASSFNKLCAGVITPCSSQFCEIIEDVDYHCKRNWNKMMALLKRDYFNSPWTCISTCAAGVLLILTLLQTYSSLLQLKISGSSG